MLTFLKKIRRKMLLDENCIILKMVVMSNTQRLERQVSSSAVELFLLKNEAPA